jgi:predicted transcriptional regulator
MPKHYYGLGDSVGSNMQSIAVQSEAQARKREKFRLEMLESWKELERTGFHVSLETVVVWLTSWGTDHVLPVPVCRTFTP